MPSNPRPSKLGSPTLPAAVVLSGAASLMYQVAWTRRLASVTSVTVTAQALVLSIFMAGLGLGAWWAGRRASRWKRPLLAYAVAETVAAVFASLSVPLIARSDAVRTAWASLGGSLSAGLWIQLVSVSLFLLIPATLLGTSLPFVIEAADRRRTKPNESARFISLLYGVNTIGAAAGSLVAGFATVEQLGLSRTTFVGAALALAAAAIAVVVQRRSPAAAEPPEPAAATPVARAPSARRAAAAEVPPPFRRWILIAAAGGFVGLAAEVLWTRLLLLVVLNTVYAFTQVLASVLFGIALGSLIAERLIQRAPSTKDRNAWLRRVAAATQLIAALLLAFAPQATLWLAQNRALQLDLATGFNLRANLIVAAFLVPPAALVAALLPLLVAMMRQRVSGAPAFGALYASNTAGAVAGSLAAGFILIPLLGTSGAVIVLTLGAVVTAFLLLAEERGIVRGLVLAGAIPCVLLARGVDLPRAIYEARVDPGTSILEFREGKQSDVMVTEDQEGHRRIWINSAWVAGTGGGHKSLGYLPPLFLDRPERVLGIALGTGQTFASVFAHGVRELECVELDRGIIDLSKKWFREASHALFEHPNVILHEDDGRAFLRATRERYDLIVLEPLQSWTAGTSNLYSHDFYVEARRVLKSGGIVAQWIPFYGQGLEQTRAMVRAAIDVFPEASLWLDDHDGILILETRRFAIAPDAFAGRIRARGLGPELATTQYADLHDLLSLFVMGPRGLREWVAGVPLLTDDRPFLEFAAGREVRENVSQMPALYRSHVQSAASRAEPVSGYLAAATPQDQEIARNASLIRDAFLKARAADPADVRAQADAYEAAMSRLTVASPLLSSRYRTLILESGQMSYGAHQWDEAIAVYQRGLDHDPTFHQAAFDLALVHAREGQFAAARQYLDRIAGVDSLRDRVAGFRRALDQQERQASQGRAPGR